MSSREELLTEREGGVLTVTFNRPDQHNAMSWAMYDGLVEACERADADPRVRVMVLRGSGSRAFVAGTDISHFTDFQDGSEGVEYERRITHVASRLEDVDVPTVAAVQGYCLGGGLVVAAACDLRVATASARFGAPIARTLGNCLSANSHSLLVHHLGPARTLDVLLRARLLSAEEAHAAGFVTEVCAEEELDRAVAVVVADLLRNAPVTMWAAKETTRRLRRANLPEDADIVARAYGSEDFRRAARAFLAKEPTTWEGR